MEEVPTTSQPRRFSALNINQRFLQSAKEAAPKAQAPAAAPTPAVDESRAGHNPRLVTAMPGRGAPVATNAGADPARKELPKDTPAAPRVPWAHVKPVAPRPNISSQDFPTAKEVMEAEKRAEERAAAQAAEEHARQQAASQELERFRGAQLPSSDHWDDMDESEDELDDVVEFGDGKQYKISEVEEELAKSHPPRPEPRVPAWGPASRAPWRSEPVRESMPVKSVARGPSAAASAPAPAPAPAPTPTWGPLAQRHSTLTGKPLPKIEPPAPVVPSKERAAEMAAEQHDEMATAAERARKRREQDEQAREAERERARQKAAQIEEQLREAERQKREARERELEAQRERLRERLRAQQEAREEHARQRLERERKEREQRMEREMREKKERELREQRRLAKEEARRAKEEPMSWRRTTPLPRHPSSSAAPAPALAAAPVPPESPVTCEPLPMEEAPVWRQYVVHIPAVSHMARRPSASATRAHAPRDPPGMLYSCEPPLDHARVGRRATAVDILFPLRRARVHLPQRRIEPAAPRVLPPQRPMDEARWLEQLLGTVEQHPSSGLFADEAPVPQGARPRRKRAPRVKLPSALSWRRPSLKALRLPYGGLLNDPFTSSAPDVPLLDTQSQSTWGATLALPLVSTAQPDPAEHSRLKSMWANTSKDTEPRLKNSLRDIGHDDMLPSPLPLSMHELREAPTSKMDVLAMPFRPGQSTESAPWSYPRDRTVSAHAGYYMPIGGYTPRRTGTDADTYVNPSDYSDFVLSDSW